jgi:hypothetical protein
MASRRVMVTEMRTAYPGGPVRPVERWVSREEADKIERVRNLGKVEPPPGASSSPREVYETEAIQNAAGPWLTTPEEKRVFGCTEFLGVDKRKTVNPVRKPLTILTFLEPHRWPRHNGR